MISRTAHEATLVLLVLLLLEGSGLFRLIVLAFALTTIAIMMWLVHHVGTGLTLNCFKSSIFSPSFLLNIKRRNQI